MALDWRKFSKETKVWEILALFKLLEMKTGTLSIKFSQETKT